MKNDRINQETYSKNIIKHLLFSTALFLPLCFFIWFYASSLLVIPVKYLLQQILILWQPDLFNAVSQNQYLLTIETLIFPNTSFFGQGDKLAVLDVVVNPMLYGYGLAVVAGLVVSVPDLKASKRILQIVIGYVLIIFVQTFGSFWETIKHLVFEAGPDAQQAILDTGLSVNLIALMYQLSYLIVPAVVPVSYWIIMNSDFIGEITGLKINSNRNFDRDEVSDKQSKENKL
ncbi:MAG: hypothetical protein JKX98_02940 [Alcanivoracaceae bacterium]|nr:hypothetical protein [Alcanivoracaceae bacterium]